LITENDLRDLMRRAETEGRRCIARQLKLDPDDYEFIRLDIKYWGSDDESLVLISRFWPRKVEPEPENIVSVASTLEKLMYDRSLE
jgi:hypothetical protein